MIRLTPLETPLDVAANFAKRAALRISYKRKPDAAFGRLIAASYIMSAERRELKGEFKKAVLLLENADAYAGGKNAKAVKKLVDLCHEEAIRLENAGKFAEAIVFLEKKETYSHRGAYVPDELNRLRIGFLHRKESELLEAKGKKLVEWAQAMGRPSIYGNSISRMLVAEKLYTVGINFLVKACEHRKEAAVYKHVWGVQSGTSKAKAAAKSAIELCDFTSELCKSVINPKKQEEIAARLKEIRYRAFIVEYSCEPYKVRSPLNDW
jgi:hypothetical protein